MMLLCTPELKRVEVEVEGLNRERVHSLSSKNYSLIRLIRLLKEPEHFANYFCAQLGNLTKILVMLDDIGHYKIFIPYAYPPSQHMVYKPHLTYLLHLYMVH